MGTAAPLPGPTPHSPTTLLQTGASGTSVDGQWPLSSETTPIAPAVRTDTRASASLTDSGTHKGWSQSQRLCLTDRPLKSHSTTTSIQTSLAATHREVAPSPEPPACHPSSVMVGQHNPGSQPPLPSGAIRMEPDRQLIACTWLDSSRAYADRN